MKKYLKLFLFLPFALRAETNYSLSVFADTGMNFTNHTDAEKDVSCVYRRVYMGSPIFNEYTTSLGKLKVPLEVGNFQLPASFDLGLNAAWKNKGLGFGYRQSFPMTLRSTVVTYSEYPDYGDGNKVQSFRGTSVMIGLYVAPFVHFRQGQNAFLEAECKIGKATLDGNLHTSYNDNGTGYDADFHYTSEAYFVEPSLKQGWFINKNFAVSLELGYNILQFYDVNVDNPSNIVRRPPASSGFLFNPFGHPAQPDIPKPDFSVDASSFTIKIHLESFLFNAFLNAPEPPVVITAPVPPAPTL